MFESIDIICSRRVPLIYVAPNFCEAEFSSTGDPIVVLSPLRRRAGPTGLIVTNDGGVLTLTWGTVDGAICYNVYAVVGENYILVAECITDPSIVLDPGTYVVTVITAEGESDPSDPITAEGPGEVCVLRIKNYGSIAQPFFTPAAEAPASSDVEWDGIWNLLISGSPDQYWYQGANTQIFRPDISIGGKAVAAIVIVGPQDSDEFSPYFPSQYWSMFVQYEDESAVVSKYWVGDKVGGNPTLPTGVYVNRDTFPEFGPPQNSDNRLSVEVEFCEF